MSLFRKSSAVSPTPEAVLEALRGVRDSQGKSIVGRITGTVVSGGHVGFALTIDPAEKDAFEPVRRECEETVRALPGVKQVSCVLTAEREAAASPPARPAAHWNTTPVEGIARIIAVASGKGGVGKSTTAVMLALALHALGRRVGLLDADIYGPSLPRMLGLSGQPTVADGRMVPPVREGVAAMSMGLVTGNDDAVVWRGPMVTKALHQMLRGTAWGTLDALLVDMPPGTGDIALSLAQAAPLSGAVIVTTPQEVAALDARKALQMFQKVNVPILGVVENMSWFDDPAGSRHRLFGEGGGRRLAEEFAVPFLGEIPLLPELRAALDTGDLARIGPALEHYREIAERLS